ncbi:hypothetical protein GCM10010912_10480 [Paenibacillus albidus]|uniref:Uncharacterized protein n=1 Tax=Paenibacillus albidus TaxID=2041023 RepID=A0A917C1H1_9BACL|nr:hypothetical protein [Paenibacillus albidus]GGF67407.1 hypothetical protein GCM10010912_10480 [Paenibacillus albidus]
MSNKKFTASLAVLLFSGSVLTVSAMAVPRIVNTPVAAQNKPVLQDMARLASSGSKAPVLKVEAPAPVSTVNSDLELMTEEELQQVYDFADRQVNSDPRLTGREMTDAEIKRRQILEDQYVYDGVRPKGSFPMQPGQSDFYYDLKMNTFTYPDRPLTDEELLQFIDWSYRVNYVMSKRHVKAVPGPEELSQKEAVVLAASSVGKLFDVDVAKLETKVIYDEAGLDKRRTWAIQFSPYKSLTLSGQGKEFWQYNVIIDGPTGIVVDTTASNFSLKRTPISTSAASLIQKDASWIHAATKIVTDKQGETRKITKAFLTDTVTNNKRGMVAVKLLLEDGSSYNAEMRYPDQSLRCLIYEPANVAK